jgi:hypothetical protein
VPFVRHTAVGSPVSGEARAPRPPIESRAWRWATTRGTFGTPTHTRHLISNTSRRHNHSPPSDTAGRTLPLVSSHSRLAVRTRSSVSAAVGQGHPADPEQPRAVHAGRLVAGGTSRRSVRDQGGQSVLLPRYHHFSAHLFSPPDRTGVAGAGEEDTTPPFPSGNAVTRSPVLPSAVGTAADMHRRSAHSPREAVADPITMSRFAVGARDAARGITSRCPPARADRWPVRSAGVRTTEGAAPKIREQW